MNCVTRVTTEYLIVCHAINVHVPMFHQHSPVTLLKVIYIAIAARKDIWGDYVSIVLMVILEIIGIQGLCVPSARDVIMSDKG